MPAARAERASRKRTRILGVQNDQRIEWRLNYPLRRASTRYRVRRTGRHTDRRESKHLVLQCRQYGPRPRTWWRQQHQCPGMDARSATGLRRVGEKWGEGLG